MSGSTSIFESTVCSWKGNLPIWKTFVQLNVGAKWFPQRRGSSRHEITCNYTLLPVPFALKEMKGADAHSNI